MAAKPARGSHGDFARRAPVATRLKVGDRVAVGLMSFRVLPNFALAFERGGKFYDAGT